MWTLMGHSGVLFLASRNPTWTTLVILLVAAVRNTVLITFCRRYPNWINGWSFEIILLQS